MSSKYNLPIHIKNYVKKELYDYEKNKKILKQLQKSKDPVSTRTILIANRKVNQIENVLKRLSKDDLDIVRIIFFKHCSQAYAETFYYISRDMYYNSKNKIIYLVAQEFELI